MHPKVLAMILCLAMCLSLFPISAFAEEVAGEQAESAAAYTESAVEAEPAAAIKAGTVKIPVYLEGNNSSKPNATLSVSVKLA